MENVARNIKKRTILSGIVNALCSNGLSIDAVAIQTGSGILPRRIEHCNIVNNQIVSKVEGEEVFTVS
jgi:GH35 family endo-1,4-beta-xylanase